jgi:hypothetical protein
MTSKSDYIREWRKTDSGRESLRQQKQRDRAKARAIFLLIDAHPGEYDVFFEMELARIKREDNGAPRV